MRGGYTVFASEAAEADSQQKAASSPGRVTPGMIFLCFCCVVALSGVSWIGFAPTSFEAAAERGKVAFAALTGNPIQQPMDFEPAMLAAMQAEEFAKRLQEIDPRPSGPRGIKMPVTHHPKKEKGVAKVQSGSKPASVIKPSGIRLTEAGSSR